jgi:hypothetical protein
MLRTGWGDLTLDSEGEEIHGGTGGGPPLRAQRWCWMGSSTGSVNEELDEDLHREELDGVHGRGASRRPPRGGARWGRGWCSRGMREEEQWQGSSTQVEGDMREE